MGAAGGAARDGAAAPCWGQPRGISARATGSVGRGGSHARGAALGMGAPTPDGPRDGQPPPVPPTRPVPSRPRSSEPPPPAPPGGGVPAPPGCMTSSFRPAFLPAAAAAAADWLPARRGAARPARPRHVAGAALRRGQGGSLRRRARGGGAALQLPPAGHQRLLRGQPGQAAPQAGTDRPRQERYGPPPPDPAPRPLGFPRTPGCAPQHPRYPRCCPRHRSAAAPAAAPRSSAGSPGCAL